MLKLSRCVVAVALSLTLLPGVGRCDDVQNSRLVVLLFKLTKPKKPQWVKPLPCAATHCPMGVCTGAATMPCCPVMHVESCPVACPVHKPDDCCKPCCAKPCCEQAGYCKVEHTLAEMRALCAEQARQLQEMHVMMKEMRSTINAMQIELQLQVQRQNQAIYPAVPKDQPPGEPYDWVPGPVPGQPYDWLPDRVPGEPYDTIPQPMQPDGPFNYNASTNEVRKLSSFSVYR